MPFVPSPRECAELRNEAKVPGWVHHHSQCVCHTALTWATNLDVDRERIEAAALLHDVGRGWTQTPAHGWEGAAWLAERDVDPTIVEIVATHVGAGLRQGDAGAPRDLIPQSLEAKLVCHADNLFSGSKPLTWEALEEKYRSKGLASAIPNLRELQDELQLLVGAPLRPFSDRRNR